MNNFLMPLNESDTLQEPGDELNLEVKKRGKIVKKINARVTQSGRRVLKEDNYPNGKKRSITQYPDGSVVETISSKQLYRLIRP